MSDRINEIYRLAEDHNLYGKAGTKISGEKYLYLPESHKALFKPHNGYAGQQAAARVVRVGTSHMIIENEPPISNAARRARELVNLNDLPGMSEPPQPTERTLEQVFMDDDGFTFEDPLDNI